MSFPLILPTDADNLGYLLVQRNALHHVRKKAVKDWDFLQEPMDVFMVGFYR